MVASYLLLKTLLELITNYSKMKQLFLLLLIFCFSNSLHSIGRILPGVYITRIDCKRGGTVSIYKQNQTENPVPVAVSDSHPLRVTTSTDHENRTLLIVSTPNDERIKYYLFADPELREVNLTSGNSEPYPYSYRLYLISHKRPFPESTIECINTTEEIVLGSITMKPHIFRGSQIERANNSSFEVNSGSED